MVLSYIMMLSITTPLHRGFGCCAIKIKQAGVRRPKHVPPNAPTHRVVTGSDSLVRLMPPSTCQAMVESTMAGIDVKDTGVYGLGAFAAKRIAMGVVVGMYEGERIDYDTVAARYFRESWEPVPAEVAAWTESRRARNVGTSGDYLFNPAPDVYIDGEDFDVANWCRFMNHAAKGEAGNNIVVECNQEEGTISFVSRRNIAVGDELLYSYGDDYFLGDDPESSKSDGC